MSSQLRGTRRAAMAAGVMALAAAALFCPASGAMASTAGHRDILLTSSALKYCHGQGEPAMGTGHAGGPAATARATPS